MKSKPNTRGIRNCNPFNIFHSPKNKWIGELSQTDYKFCRFDTLEHGVRAGIILLRNYIEKHRLDNVPSIIMRFAPESENNTLAYINFVSGVLVNAGCDPLHISFNSDAFLYLCKAILQYESRLVVPLDYIRDIIFKFHIKSTFNYEQELFKETC